MIGELPKSLMIDGVDYKICPTCKNVLRILESFEDPELEPFEKWIVATFLLFKDFKDDDDVLDAIENGFNIEEAQKQISWFISAGKPEKNVLENPVFDWKQDEQMIFSAVNKVAGKELRKKKEWKKLHWWTFLGYFNEVGEGEFSFIAGIRNKLNKKKKLEKHEKEFYDNNKERVELKCKISKEEQEQKDYYNSLLDGMLKNDR